MQQVAIRIVYQQLVAITMNATFFKIITHFLDFLYIILCFILNYNSIFMNKSLDLWKFGQVIITTSLLRGDSDVWVRKKENSIW